VSNRSEARRAIFVSFPGETGIQKSGCGAAHLDDFTRLYVTLQLRRE
jgi:hypothetical protein